MKNTCDKRFRQARRLLDEQRDFEAEQAFSDIILLYPESEGAYGNRGLARMHLGRDEDALADFREVVRLHPDDAMGYARMAEALRNLGRHEEALQMVSVAIEIDPGEPDAHYIRGWLFAMCRQYQLAAEDLAVFVDAFGDESGEAGEVVDLLSLCRTLSEAGVSSSREQELLYESGFSHSIHYNESHESDGLFCPYAHCIRTRPVRGPEALGVCPVTGFECPGHEEQAAHCEEHPPVTEP